jgi:hypothetical protein
VLGGVMPQGPGTTFPCAVGADEADCRRAGASVSAAPLGAAGSGQPGRIADMHNAQVQTSWRSVAPAGAQVGGAFLFVCMVADSRFDLGSVPVWRECRWPNGTR